MTKHLVFVYGSLKKGFHNSRLLNESTFLGETRTKSRKFYMKSLGAFPALFWASRMDTPSQGYSIEGEVYEVDGATLERLDRLESNGKFYNREEVLLADGKTAWVYLCLRDYDLRVAPDKDIKRSRNHSQKWLDPYRKGW